MSQLRTFVASTLAEAAQRLREPRLWYLAILTMAAATFLLPASDSGYTTMTAGGKIPILSSGFAGTMAGALFAALFAMPCFFVTGSTLTRDRESGFSNILASSPIWNASLIASRVCAGMMTMLIVVAGVGLSLGFTFAYRHEARFNLVEFYERFVLFSWPAVAFFTALGVLIDATLRERSSGTRASIGLGVWIVLMSVVVFSSSEFVDVFGFVRIQASIRALVGLDTTNLAFGIVSAPPGSPRFSWGGVSMSADFVRQRLLVGAAVIPIWLASVFAFDRFRNEVAVPQVDGIAVEIIKPWARFPRTPSQPGSRFTSFIIADTIMRLQTKRNIAYASAGVVVLLMFIDLYVAKLLVLLLPFAWYLAADSTSGTVGIGQLIFSLPQTRRWYVEWKTVALLVLPLATSIGVIFHAVSAEGILSAALIVCGLTIECLWLVGSQLVTGGPIFGLVTALLSWYALAASKTPFFDYVGLTHRDPNTLLPLIGIILTVYVFVATLWRTAFVGKLLREDG